MGNEEMTRDHLPASAPSPGTRGGGGGTHRRVVGPTHLAGQGPGCPQMWGERAHSAPPMASWQPSRAQETPRRSLQSQLLLDPPQVQISTGCNCSQNPIRVFLHLDKKILKFTQKNK